MTPFLFPPLESAAPDTAMRFGESSLTWDGLRDAAGAVASRVSGRPIAILWATPQIETAIAAVGCLAAGMTVVPINPASGESELAHILGEVGEAPILSPPAAVLPPSLAERQVVEVRTADRGELRPASPDPEAIALVIFTSGTTGRPKGVQIAYRAVAANLDALFHRWQWTSRDVLVHALPLFHVHGLVLGVLGPVRAGSPLVHPGRFDIDAIAGLLARDGTMLFGVPTMYHRLAAAIERSDEVASALARARLLISGSAPLAARDRERIEAATGRTVIERYGLTETLMVCASSPSGARRGWVGPPLEGVSVRLVDEDGVEIDPAQDEIAGEVEVRGTSLFSGYRNHPELTDAAMHDGWFRTGDTAIRAPDGQYRVLGRTSLDIVKSGGFKVGTGEIEEVLAGDADVAEVAVAGLPDEDLGQRLVAWIVPRPDRRPEADRLARLVASSLAPHKRPREIRIVEALPRNSLGKVEKRRLPDLPYSTKST